VTLQNLNGSGKGCPIVSTTFQAQAAAINAGSQPAPLASPSVPSPSLTPTINNASTHPASSASSSVSPTSLAPATKNAGSPTSLSATPSASSSSLTLAQIEALAPQLGFSAGKNPTGKDFKTTLCASTAFFTHQIMQAPVTAMAQ
jgi:hypothetical protein